MGEPFCANIVQYGNSQMPTAQNWSAICKISVVEPLVKTNEVRYPKNVCATKEVWLSVGRMEPLKGPAVDLKR